MSHECCGKIWDSTRLKIRVLWVHRLKTHYCDHFRICITATWPSVQSVSDQGMIWMHLDCFLWLVTCFWMKHGSCSVHFALRRIIGFRKLARLEPVSSLEDYTSMTQKHMRYNHVVALNVFFRNVFIRSSTHYAFMKHIFIFYITKQQSC